MNLPESLQSPSEQQLRELVQHPDWYLEFTRYRQSRMLGAAAVRAVLGGNLSDGIKAAKEAMVATFEHLLADEVVSLGTQHQRLENWDEERQPVDTIVLHHTSRQPGLRLETLNAMHLLRLYVPRYQSKTAPVLNEDGSLQPIYSGHFNDGKRVFYAYHWLVRGNGEAERLLQDNETGWHAGNWDVNCRSVAICIDNDLTSKRPNGVVMDSIAELIAQHYPDITISPETLRGHGEITDTVCPGSQFLGGWKLELLEKLSV